MSKPCNCGGTCVNGFGRCPLAQSYPSVAEMQARHAGASRDSLATQLEQMRRERDEARAKLARIREVAECDYHDTPRVVLRIIDEKEGGQ